MTSANTKKQVKFLGYFLLGLNLSDFQNPRGMRGLNEVGLNLLDRNGLSL